MIPLTMEELRGLRAGMANLGYTDEELDAYIHLVDNIVASIIHQNNGVHSVQLSLAARANRAFKKDADSTGFLSDGPHQKVASESDCAISRKTSKRKPELR